MGFSCTTHRHLVSKRIRLFESNRCETDLEKSKRTLSSNAFSKGIYCVFFALECSMRKYIKIQLPTMECKAQSQLLLYNRVQSGQTHFKPILLIKWSSEERNQSKLISDSEKYIYTFFVRSMQKNEHHVNSNFCRTLSYQCCDASHWYHDWLSCCLMTKFYLALNVLGMISERICVYIQFTIRIHYSCYCCFFLIFWFMWFLEGQRSSSLLNASQCMLRNFYHISRFILNFHSTPLCYYYFFVLFCWIYFFASVCALSIIAPIFVSKSKTHFDYFF